jgi:hypothetical protein
VIIMMTLRYFAVAMAMAFGPFALTALYAQTSVQEQNPNPVPTAPPATMDGGPKVSQRGGRGRGIFGKISAIQSDSIEVTGQDGRKVGVKLTGSTEFRKDQQPANIYDFKVDDMVIVRTERESSNPNGATALLVASGSPGMMARGGAGGPGAGMAGTLGKDYVVGEVKSVDPPKLVVLRVDNVTQTLELNEETSLRKGRESITMADIQAGDHIFARGAVADDVFVPKAVNVIQPEQWKRLEEMRSEGGQNGAPPNAKPPASQQKPPEQPN